MLTGNNGIIVMPFNTIVKPKRVFNKRKSITIIAHLDNLHHNNALLPVALFRARAQECLSSNIQSNGDI